MWTKLELLMLLISTCVCLSAATFTIDELSFDTINGNECVVYATDPFRLHGSIDIPSHFMFDGQSFTVTAIRCDAFRGSKISRVKIPSTVRTIGPMAFCVTRVKSVDIPSSVKIIGHDAFRECHRLKVVQLHEGLLQIEPGAFLGCHSLRQIIIPASVRYIDDDCFCECVNLRNVQFLGEPDSCGTGVFIDCGLTKPVHTSRYLLFVPPTYQGTYAIPYGITIIPGGILEFCEHLDTIIFPESIDSICIETYVNQQCWIFQSKNPPVLHISPDWPDLYPQINESISFVVPQGCRDTYSESPSWIGITNITEK